MSELRYYPDSLLDEIDEARVKQQLPAIKRNAPRIAKSGYPPAVMNYLGAIDHLMYYAICMSIVDEKPYEELANVGRSREKLCQYLSIAPSAMSISFLNNPFLYMFDHINDNKDYMLSNSTLPQYGNMWVDKDTEPTETQLHKEWRGNPSIGADGKENGLFTFNPPMNFANAFYRDVMVRRSDEDTIGFKPIGELDITVFDTPVENMPRTIPPYVLKSYEESTSQLKAFFFMMRFPIGTSNITYNADSITYENNSFFRQTPDGKFIRYYRWRQFSREGSDFDYTYKFYPESISDTQTEETFNTEYLGDANGRTFASEVGEYYQFVPITVAHYGRKGEVWRTSGPSQSDDHYWRDMYTQIVKIKCKVRKEPTSTGYKLVISHDVETLKSEVNKVFAASHFSLRKDDYIHGASTTIFNCLDTIEVELGEPYYGWNTQGTYRVWSYHYGSTSCAVAYCNGAPADSSESSDT